MKDIETWLRRTAARADRAVRIEEALLGGRFPAYAAYRLRFFGLRTAVSAVLHAVRILLAFRFFAPKTFTVILLVEAAASLGASFWWGSLEVLREKVRDLRRDGRPQDAAGEIAPWLYRSIRLAAAALALSALWIPAAFLGQSGEFTAADFFIVTIFVRLGLDLVTRCYHSGIYAIRRVYRPLWSLIGVEIIGFGGVLAGWPLVGPWALPAASLVSAVLSNALTLVFTQRAYRHSGFDPRPHLRSKAKRPPRGWKSRDWWNAGVSYALMRLDGIVVLALAASSRHFHSPLAAFFLAVGPLVRAGFDWVQLFYFDLKRLDSFLLNGVRMRLERRLLALSVLIGAAIWPAALLLGFFIYGRMTLAFSAVLLVLFIVRSALASLEMRAFARGRYRPLFVSAGLGLAGWIAAGAFGGNALPAMAAGIAGLCGGAVGLVLSEAGKRDETDAASARPLPLPDWIHRLQSICGSVFLGIAVFSPGSSHRGLDEPVRWEEEDRWAHRRTAEAAAKKLGRHGAVAFGGPARLVWFENGGDRLRLTADWILTRGAGLIGKADISARFASGPEAAASVASDFLGPKTGRFRPADDPTPSALAGKFRWLVPGGRIIFPGGPRPAVAPGGFSKVKGQARTAEMDRRASPASERREVLSAALAYAAALTPSTRPSGSSVTAFIEDGEIFMIFVAGPNAPPNDLDRWNRIIRRANLVSAFYRNPGPS